MSLAQVLRDALMRRAADRSGGRFLADQPERPCWHCGQPTRYVEINFEAPLHPGPCADQKEIEYWRATAEDHRPPRETRP
ncbi:hypothetical protein [Pseudonocardia sp. D17]|uniref:hypothetical protein n=1 Tax=Pseudonocardia sp. D17 TaxID=882661 RepID=UPI002B3B04ED|nr:hypothetical protein PSD17_39450 [Pseudonocardia sp. D17]